jgi:hypothetical protein
MRVGRTLSLRMTLLALAAAGCGATPPQAPLDQAKKLDDALSGISTACGESYQVTAFPGPRKTDLQTLEATAARDAVKLASVYRRNPAWVYQGDTIRALVDDSLSTLRQCGLHSAAAVLEHATKRGGI